MSGTDEISDTLGRLHQVLRRAAARQGGREKLPDAQVELLRLVQRHPGISVREAAERLHAAPNTVSTLVGDLAVAGLIDRGRSPENRRQVRLTLTPLATDRLDDYHAQRRRLVAEALGRLDAGARARIAAAVPDLRRLTEELATGVPHSETAAVARNGGETA